MNAKIFASRLTSGGFSSVHTGVRGIDVYIRKLHEKAYIVGVLDFALGGAPDGGQLRALESNLAFIYNTTEIIFVAFAYDSYGARLELSECGCYWIYNEQSCMLEIYDGQPGEFLNVRQMLERPESTVAGYIFSCNNFIIAANIIVFIIMEAIGDTKNALFLYEHGGITVDSLFERYEIYRLLTSIFLHAGVRHIFNNMLVLFFIGNSLENIVGRIKYLLIYFGSGIAGGIVSQLWGLMQDDRYTVCVGASGAIFGIIGAMIWVLIRNRGRLGDRALPRLIIYVVLSIYIGLTRTGISLPAHIGGLMGGFLLALLLYRKDDVKV